MIIIIKYCYLIKDFSVTVCSDINTIIEMANVGFQTVTGLGHC